MAESDIKPGAYCLAPFQDETLEYYRARIESVRDRKVQVKPVEKCTSDSEICIPFRGQPLIINLFLCLNMFCQVPSFIYIYGSELI